LKLLGYVLEKKGEPYAYKQLLAIAFKKIMGRNKVGDWDKDSMICSEFYVNAIKKCFERSVYPGKKAHEITPLDIYYSKNMTKLNKVTYSQYAS
jgi:hypothetical protein